MRDSRTGGDGDAIRPNYNFTSLLNLSGLQNMRTTRES